jgi:L-asparagine oxygenase
MSSAFATQDHFIIDLNPEEGRRITEFLTQSTFNPFESDADFERFLNHSFMLAQVLPPNVITALLEFRRNGNDDGVLVIRGFPIDGRKIGLTPEHWSMKYQTKHCYETEMYLLGVASILGEVFSFSTQHEGNIVQNVVPLRTDMYEQVGTGSKVFLEWHTEDAFHRLAADFIGLLCLRSDPAAATTFASIRKMHIPDTYKRCLFERKFQAGIDKAHGGSGQAEDGPVISVLSGPYDDPDLRLDTSCIRALPGEPEAQEALDYLTKQMFSVARQLVLREGDLLFMDNKRVVHGRTAFTPRFDGTDRWLQRISIATDFRKSYPARTKRFRVIEKVARFYG